MENLTAAVETQIDDDSSRPVLLARFILDAGTIRYAAANVDFVFPAGGDTYTAKAFGVGNKKTNINGQIIEMDLQFDNISGDMHAYNVAERFDGKQFTLWKGYRDAVVSASDYREMIDGYMQEPRFDKEWMYLKVVSGESLGRRTMNSYFQKPCNNLFGDARCNADGLADLTDVVTPVKILNGVADAGGTVSTLVDAALVQADDYWNYGRIEITIAGVKYYRRIVDFVAATDTVCFDVPLHTAVSAGDIYTMYKGCPLTWDACQALHAYGPTADNKANFIGFIHLLRKEG